MKQRDKGKASLVEFLRSLKYTHNRGSQGRVEIASHFAQFQPRARTGRQFSSEDSQLIRSAN